MYDKIHYKLKKKKKEKKKIKSSEVIFSKKTLYQNLICIFWGWTIWHKIGIIYLKQSQS